MVCAADNGLGTLSSEFTFITTNIKCSMWVS